MNTHHTHAESSRPAMYHIRVEGELGPQWAAWFDGMTVTLDAGDTLLAGVMPDQAGLFGVLRKVRDLGLPLVAVARIPSTEAQHTQEECK